MSQPQETSTATAQAVATTLHAANMKLADKLDAEYLDSGCCDADYGGEGYYISAESEKAFADMIEPVQRWLDAHFFEGVVASANEREWVFASELWQLYTLIFECRASQINNDLRPAHERLLGAHERYLRRKAIAEMSDEELEERATLADPRIDLDLPIGVRFSQWLDEVCEEEGHECQDYSIGSDMESPYEWCPGCMLRDELTTEYNKIKYELFPPPPPPPRPVFDAAAWRAQEAAKFTAWLEGQQQMIKDIVRDGGKEAKWIVKDLYYGQQICWTSMLDDLDPGWEEKSRVAGLQKQAEEDAKRRADAARAALLGPPCPLRSAPTTKPKTNFHRPSNSFQARGGGGERSGHESSRRPVIPDKVAAPEAVRAVACNKMPEWETPPAHWPEGVRCAGGEPYMHSAKYRKWLKVSFEEAGIKEPVSTITAPTTGGGAGAPESESEEEFDVSFLAKKRK